MTGHAIAAVGSGRDTCHMPHDDVAGAPAEPSFRALVRELTREWVQIWLIAGGAVVVGVLILAGTL